jgi:polyhydroxyalkanoate synthesis regulator phasin
MFEVFKKCALIGLGVLSFSEEKFKQCIDELVKRGEVSEEEGEDLLKKFSRKAEEEKESLEEWMKKRLGDLLKKMNLKSLDKRVKELTKEMKGEG